jgi:hypothetical protein
MLLSPLCLKSWLRSHPNFLYWKFRSKEIDVASITNATKEIYKNEVANPIAATNFYSTLVATATTTYSCPHGHPSPPQWEEGRSLVGSFFGSSCSLKMQMKPPKQTSHGWEFIPTDTNNVLINVFLSFLPIFNYFDQVYVLIRKIFFLSSHYSFLKWIQMLF